MQERVSDTQVRIEDLGVKARKASHILALLDAERKRESLLYAADSLELSSSAIEASNRKDMQFGKQKGLTSAKLDRLYLDSDRIQAMVSSVRLVAELVDPVGRVLDRYKAANGLIFEKVAVPIGVIGIIYEARPNVTADAASLCVKAGNAALLRCGSESFHSATAIADAFRAGLEKGGLPMDSVQLIPSRARSAVGDLLGAVEYVDVIVPRGGKSLIERVQNEAKMAVFAHLEGLCHTYIDGRADPVKAKSIVLNAKLRRVGICGATETLLIHKDFAYGADVVKALLDRGCEVRGCDRVRLLDKRVVAASESDWHSEYLDSIISVCFVDSWEQAIAHIEHYGSHHTDAIITEDASVADEFLRRVNSAIVIHNASTQYADGGEFGMGAEIGISTGRMHARGPVGVNELTIFKYCVHGQGQCRP